MSTDESIPFTDFRFRVIIFIILKVFVEKEDLNRSKRRKNQNERSLGNGF